MKIPMYQIDAFADLVFSGNPAAVCLLGDEWPSDYLMASIAMENNLAETAFVLRKPGGRPGAESYFIRWFTPEIEIDLCGHATLASAFALRAFAGYAEPRVSFASRSGPLVVDYDGDMLRMDFPARPGEPRELPKGIARALGLPKGSWREAIKARDWMIVLEDEAILRALKPDFHSLAAQETVDVGVIITAPGRQLAPGQDFDFVSRFFAPGAGIPEDPVTGSSHCTLIPYWARRLGKSRLVAFQASARGGRLECEDRGERVGIGGKCVCFMKGEIEV